METRFKEFPPGWSHLKIPVSSRRAALAGLALYAPCRPRAVWAHRAAWITTALAGPKWLPGTASTWQAPMASEVWEALLSEWRHRLGPFDALAVYQRLQAERSGLSVLLIDGRVPRAFVKLRPAPGEKLKIEQHTLETVAAFHPRSFSVPEPLQAGALAGWRYLAVRPLPVRPHRVPSRPPIAPILEEVRSALSTLPCPQATPSHWTPMHGDFTPWNLRQLQETALVLLDWEDAGSGPPGADAVLYRAASAALSQERALESSDVEAIDFWEMRVRERAKSNPRDTKLSQALLVALAAMRP